MGWFAAAGVIVLCGVCGLLGLTAGINMNPASTVRYVPNWGSLGDWISGTGALLAVLVTLWLADRQRREDVEKLRVDSATSWPVGPGFAGYPFISLTLTSEGKRPVNVIGIGIVSEHSKMYMPVPRFGPHSPVKSLPTRLDYGEQAGIHLEPGLEREVAEFVRDHCGGNDGGLFFEVYTSTGKWREKFSPGFFEMRRLHQSMLS